MSYIYQPSGKAREYGELALNLYTGCSHGCAYCYAPQATRTTPERFANPKVRPIDEARLQKEIDHLRPASSPGSLQSLPSLPPSVFLCFTCDPYQHLDQEAHVTRRIIKTLNRSGIGVNILTKAGFRSTCDFDLLACQPQALIGDAPASPPGPAGTSPQLNSYGATLTFFKDTSSRIWEPGAALPGERLDALELAYEKRIPTWASLEPVIDPEQSLHLIELAAPFVDTFKVGKWNHDHPSRRPEGLTWSADKIDWAEFARNAVDRLESLGKKYYIKQDLAAYLPEGTSAKK